MMKIASIVLCCMVALSAAQEEGTFELVPFVANLCQTGCPQVCQTLRTFCVPSPNSDCDAMKSRCDTICAMTCSCITACGPDCDEFETNCVANGLPALAGVFCPITGGVCDVNCVVGCPQQTMMALFQQQLGQTINAVQGFIRMMIIQSQPQES